MDSICALVFGCGTIVGGAVVAIGFIMARETVAAIVDPPRPNRSSRYHEEFEPRVVRRR